MTIRRMHFACWIPQATHTHTYKHTHTHTLRICNNCFLFHGNELNEKTFDVACYCNSIFTIKKLLLFVCFKRIIKFTIRNAELKNSIMYSSQKRRPLTGRSNVLLENLRTSNFSKMCLPLEREHSLLYSCSALTSENISIHKITFKPVTTCQIFIKRHPLRHFVR